MIKMAMIISGKGRTVTYRWSSCFKRPDPRVVKFFFAPLICFLITAAALYFCGIRINLSPSLPCGVWQIQQASHNDLNIGDSVVIDKSAIPDNTMDLVKDVGALPGDIITRHGSVVYRNGVEMPLSTIHATNSKGDKLQCINYPIIVPEGHIWLSSRHVRGYDSRYFGPVSVQPFVIGKVRLLWAW